MRGIIVMKLSQTILTMIAAAGVSLAAVDFPGQAPGAAKASPANTASSNDHVHYVVSNNLFTAEFSESSGGLSFESMKLADGTELVQKGGPVFTVNLQGGKTLDSNSMKKGKVSVEELKADPKHPQLARRFPGKAVKAVFTAPDDSFSVVWRAVLRDGSHYLRQEYTIKAKKDTAFVSITPMQFDLAPHGKASISGNTERGTVVVNDLVFAGLETPMSIMTVGNQGGSAGAEWNPAAWQEQSFGSAFNIPESFKQKYGDKYSAQDGPTLKHLAVAEGPATFSQAGKCDVTFRYKGGSHRLNMVGVQLVDASGSVVAEDVHEGHTGEKSDANAYSLNVPKAGDYTLRYWVETQTESVASKGEIAFSSPVALPSAKSAGSAQDNTVRGTWSRKTTLPAGQSWKVSSVIGIFAPQQQRRSFLAYSEREKAAAYRTFIHYNDWYEIGIRLHDNKDPMKRTTEPMWLELLDTWNRELFTKRKTYIDAFVIDDGWDDFNSLWDFHKGFPNGFAKMNEKATAMKAGMGAWLGPVGGYGSSKSQRISYWNSTHPNNQIGNFQLSNKEYFDAFVGRCKFMIEHYDMRYFKFDGISTHFHAKGPGNEEDAEGIIAVEVELRKARPDIFLNTTVGTWASPFWFHFADSIWRQENDFGQAGNVGDDRDKWITYRDRLVHEVFVEGAPLFPINSIMTHGLMITKNGPPHVMSREPKNCIKEMRCAFGSGSALQELYVDQDLMNQEKGILWDELAACIKWMRRNADVLPDTHWVGGNPWDGKDGDIYGWASWNKKKCTLTLRNSSAKEKTLHTTLRKVLDVPPSVKGSVTLKSSFADQRALPGIIGSPVDVDKEIDITLQPFEVIVMEGTNK